MSSYDDHLCLITSFREILAQCPDISQITVQRAWGDLLKKGELLKLSRGRYASYVLNEK